MISSIGSTCNIAIFPSVHAHDMYMVIKFYFNEIAGYFINACYCWERVIIVGTGMKSRCNNVVLRMLLTYSRANTRMKITTAIPFS